MLLFSYLLVIACVLDAQKKCPIETVLLSIQNKFWLRNKKIFFLLCILIWRPVTVHIARITEIDCCYVVAFHSFQQFFS